VTTHAGLLAVACLALAVALIAAGLAVYAIRSTFPARTLAHRHERRSRDQGPPAGVPERRHRHPDDTRTTRRQANRLRDGEEEPQLASSPSSSSSANADPVEAGPPTYPPRPAPRHRAVDEPETVEHAPPTADMRTLPPPGSIPRS
jgi:hypothetical protein